MTAQRKRKERRIVDVQKPYVQARKLTIKELCEKAKNGDYVAQRVLEDTERHVLEVAKVMMGEL